MKSLILASSSPRRKEILEALGVSFSVLAPDIDEDQFETLPPAERVLALAKAKSRCCIAAHALGKGDYIVIAADTLVSLPKYRGRGWEAYRDPSGALTLGKPRSRAEAQAMVELISGISHDVTTGLVVCDCAGGQELAELSTSTVRFSKLSLSEINDYVETGEWEGAAGGYRIQGRAACHIDRIEGSWSGIVGLPIHHLYGMFRRLGIDLLPKGGGR